MGLFDAIKGLLSGDGLQGILESTGLGDVAGDALGGMAETSAPRADPCDERNTAIRTVRSSLLVRTPQR